MLNYIKKKTFWIFSTFAFLN